MLKRFGACVNPESTWLDSYGQEILLRPPVLGLYDGYRLGCGVTLQLAVELLHYWLQHLASLPDVPHSFTSDVLGFSM